MYPALHILGRDIGTYALCAAVGAVFMLFLLARLARMRGRNGEDAMIAGLLCAVPVLVGGSLLYAATNIPYLQVVLSHASSYPDAAGFLKAVAQGFGGFVFYGGLAGALATVAVYCRVKREPLGQHLDMLAVAVPLFHVFGRLGCFLGGCCFGVECSVGFTYHDDPIAIANGVSRFPVQLLESALCLVLFAVLYRLYARHALEGSLVSAYLVAYGCIRFADEFLRGDAYRGFLGPLSTSQWISLVAIAAGVVLLVRWHVRRHPSPAGA